MSSQTLAKATEKWPMVVEDFFKPWNEWFTNGNNQLSRSLTLPAVNISEGEDHYELSLAVPGMEKNDFQVDVDGDLLTISSEKEENKTEHEKKFTRKEYNYSSFQRAFTIPDEVNVDKIEASYKNGVLTLSLPYKPGSRKKIAKQIAIK